MPSVKDKTKKVPKAPKKETPASLFVKGGLRRIPKEKIHSNPPFKKEGDALSVAVYDQEGKEVEKIGLPPEIFGLKINNDLVKQAVEAQMSQARIPYAHAKDRSEVRGGGKKPWRQKGTGRARHGSIRSPIWVGGGVTFGPRKEKVFAKKINKKMKRQALLMVLSGKAKDNELIFLDDLKLEQPKTKLMVRVLKNVFGGIAGVAERSSALTQSSVSLLRSSILIILPQKYENIIRATRNIPKISTIGANSLNVVDLLSYKYLVMTKEVIEVIKNTFSR